MNSPNSNILNHLNPAQARIYALKQQKQNVNKELKAEQQRQNCSERIKTAQQALNKARLG